MEQIITYVTLISVLVPITLGIITYTHGTRRSTLILVLCLFSMSCDVLSYAWAVLFHNNYWVIHAYTVGELIILGLFFRLILNQKIVDIIIFIVLVVYIGDLLFFSGITLINPYMKGAICLTMIFLSVWSYWSFFKSEAFVFLDTIPDFWMVTGILTYFAGALFSWLFFLVLHNQEGQGLGIWAFHNIAGTLKNILFAIGLWKVRTV